MVGTEQAASRIDETRRINKAAGEAVGGNESAKTMRVGIGPKVYDVTAGARFLARQQVAGTCSRGNLMAISRSAARASVRRRRRTTAQSASERFSGDESRQTPLTGEPSEPRRPALF